MELDRLSVRQIRKLIKQGPLKKIVPELVQTVLESILVIEKANLRLGF